ncbi:uncharacterized protein [Miscanthus floridulus]|uniref:uncharacterized protein n=1 Tax=Miscanthus floridulus TaxID=154761 RepID=UPI00345AF576
MAHNLAVTLFILAVYVSVMATPFVYATKSPTSTTAKGHEATKEGDAPAKAPEAATKGSAKDNKAGTKGDAPVKMPDAATKGSSKDHKADAKGDAPAKTYEAATKGSAKVPKANAKGAAAKGPGAPMSWPDGGPEFVEMVIKNPFLKTTPPSSDGLPIDPTPEGSMT